MTGSYSKGSPEGALRVTHVLPFDQPRGAQMYARTLVGHLESSTYHHEMLTIFEGEDSNQPVDHPLGVSRGTSRSLGLDPRAVWRLRRALRAIRSDILVAHGGESAKYLALSGADVPIVYLNIGSAHPKLARPMNRAVHRFYLSRIEVLVAVSNFIADEARHRFGVPEDRIVVIPNSRDPGRFRAGSRDTDSTRVRLIWIGQLDEAKRPELFLEVLRTLSAEALPVEGVLVGDGPERAKLADQARDLDVAILGRRDDVADLLSASDVMVFTGRPPEGMPGVLIEAGLSGLPVVSTRVPGADDVVEDGETGFLVELSDTSSLIQQVRNLVMDPELRHRMGNAARERCAELFSVSATTAQWNALFDRLVQP